MVDEQARTIWICPACDRHVADVHMAQSEIVRSAFAAAIGYEMLAEGKRTGNAISYGVMSVLRRGDLRTAILDAMGLEVRVVDEGLGGNDDVLIVRPRGDATDTWNMRATRLRNLPRGEATDA